LKEGMMLKYDFEKKAEILKALAHPIRLCIVKGLLSEGESNVTKMQHCLEAPQSTISQHLTKLRASGIVQGKRKGVEMYYSIVNEDIERIVRSLFQE
jgi:DNA-binding transcriptional ArsR family regulator